MVTITVDPKDPSRLILTATATLYIDRVLVETLNSEVESAIRTQARKDLKGNKEVQKQIAEAATQRLLSMLGQATQPETPKAPNAD